MQTVLEELCNQYNELQEKSYFQCKELLIEFTAWYGEWLTQMYEGFWMWEGRRYLLEKCGRDELDIDVLELVYAQWKAKMKWNADELAKEQEQIFS